MRLSLRLPHPLVDHLAVPHLSDLSHVRDVALEKVAAAGKLKDHLNLQAFQGVRFGFGQDEPPPSAFQEITGTVKQILPNQDINEPHQRFLLSYEQALSQDRNLPDGTLFEVDNDTRFGTYAPVNVGDQVTIKGVLYSDPGGKNGIHWTHQLDEGTKGDPTTGGFIEVNGQIYD